MSDDLGTRKAGRRRRTTRRLTRRPVRVPGDDVPRMGSLVHPEDLDLDTDPDDDTDAAPEPSATDRSSVDMVDVVVEDEADGPASGVMAAPQAREAEPASSSSAPTITTPPAAPAPRGSSPPHEPESEPETNPQIRLSDMAQRRSSSQPASEPDPEVEAELDSPTRPRIEISREMALLAGRETSLELPPVAAEEPDADTNPRLRIASEPPVASVIVTRSQVISDRPAASFEEPAPSRAVRFEEEVKQESPSSSEVDDIETLDIEDESHKLEIAEPDTLASEGLAVRPSKAPPPPPDTNGKTHAKKPPPPPPTAPAKKPAARPAAAPKQRQWWDELFSDDYLQSVPPPTAAQVAKQVDFVEQSLGLAKGAAVLDVGCGTGLHALELARRGYLVVALDLSLPMITRAAEDAQQEGLRINFLHTDLREIAFDGMFDAIVCLGTTFGFFDDESNRDVLARLRRALKPQGRLFLDVVNRDHVIGSQPSLVWFEGEGCVVMEESDFNFFTSRLSVKRTMMREDGRQSDAEYSLRLYSLHELGQLMVQVGFRVKEVSGQEATRSVFFGTNSTRIILLAERRGAREKGDGEPAQIESGKPQA